MDIASHNTIDVIIEEKINLNSRILTRVPNDQDSDCKLLLGHIMYLKSLLDLKMGYTFFLYRDMLSNLLTFSVMTNSSQQCATDRFF